MKRLYIIECDFYCNTIYCDKKSEHFFNVYEFKERQLFIEKYLHYIGNDLYFKNIKTYVCDYDQNEITYKMDEIINNI